MANLIEQAEVETPNTKNSEVQTTIQNNKHTVQPKNYNYAQTGSQNNSNANNSSNTTNMQLSTTSKPTQTNTQTQPLEPVAQPTGSTIPIQTPSDFYDDTVQGYLNSYNHGVEINDYQAQINALTALDKYRVSNGYKAIYTSDIYQLNNLRNQKIQGIIKDYENQISQAVNSGNYTDAELIGQELQKYKNNVNYKDTVNNSANYLGNLEYKSSYESVINGIVNELLTMRFTYDPSDDEALIKAQEYAINTAYESMNAKGILDSTMTAQVVASTIANLQPVYEEMAREEFYDNLNRLQSMATFVIGLDETQYNRWLSNVQMNLEYYQAEKDEISYQWDRVNQLGYVDNEASVILGVPVGILSPAIRQSIQEAEAEANKKYNELYTDMSLAEAKAKLELETYAQKKAIDYAYKKEEEDDDDESTGSSGNIDSKYKFIGELNATALNKQLEIMYDNSTDEENIDMELLSFARDNAKNYDAFVQAISGIGYTVEEANKILNPSIEDMEDEEKMNHIDNLYANGEIDYEKWKAMYGEHELDYIPRTQDYNTVVEEIGKTYTKEQAMQVLEYYIQQGLEDEIGQRIFEELEKDYI